MRRAYVLVSGLLVLLGLIWIIEDLRARDPLDGFIAALGMGVLVLGVLNFLNLSYGLSTGGLRRVTIGCNVATTALMGWFFLGDGESVAPFSVVLLLMGVVGTGLSLDRRSLSGPT